VTSSEVNHYARPCFRLIVSSGDYSWEVKSCLPTEFSPAVKLKKCTKIINIYLPILSKLIGAPAQPYLSVSLTIKIKNIKFLHLLGCYAANCGLIPTLWDYLSIPSSRVNLSKMTA
jgi:hypothetical protein